MPELNVMAGTSTGMTDPSDGNDFASGYCAGASEI